MGVHAETASSNGAASSADPGRTGANAQGTDPGSTPTSRPADSPPAERGPDYFREAFSRVRGYRQSAGPKAPQAPPASQSRGPESEQPAPTTSNQPQRQGQARPEPATTFPSGTPASGEPVVALTQTELARRVQAEADRVLSKRQADARAQAQREEERRLRDEDPYGYVQLIKDREQQSQVEQGRLKEATALLEQQLHHYDRGILDSVVGQLPEKVRQNVLKSTRAEGIQGRAEVAQKSLAALRQMWNAEGRETAKTALMKDPTFVKEILARYAGQIERPEPESVRALPPSSTARTASGNEAVNSWMRQASQGIRGR